MAKSTIYIRKENEAKWGKLRAVGAQSKFVNDALASEQVAKVIVEAKTFYAPPEETA